MTARHVVARCVVATVIGLALIVSGGTASPSPGSSPPGAPPSSGQAGPLQADCVDRITEPEQAGDALAQARPGNTVCLSAMACETLSWR